MNGVDPKWVFYLGILVTIETAIGQGTVKLTNVVAEAWIPYITGWCTLLSFVGNVVMTALAGYSSKTAGPLVKPVIIAAVALAALFAFPGDARAQTKLGPIGAKIIEGGVSNGAATSTTPGQFCDLLNLLPGCKAMEPADLWKKFTDQTVRPDLVYAKALADHAATDGSKLRSTCLGAVIKAHDQVNATDLKDDNGQPITLPTPHVITLLEQGAEMIDNLQPTAPIISSCAAAANAAKVNAMQFLTGMAALIGAKVATGGVLP